MAATAIGNRKRLAMGHEPRSDPRSGGMVVPRPWGGTREPGEPGRGRVADSRKPTLESRAGVTHPATDVGRKAGRRGGDK